MLLSVSSSPALKAPSATKSRATNTVAVSVLVGDGLICAITVGTKEGFGDGWLVGDVVGTGAGAAEDGTGVGAIDGSGIGAKLGRTVGGSVGAVLGSGDGCGEGAGTGAGDGFRVATTTSTSKESSTVAPTPLSCRDWWKLCRVVRLLMLPAKALASSTVDTISKVTSHRYAPVSRRVFSVAESRREPRRALPSLRRSSVAVVFTTVMTRLRIAPSSFLSDEKSASF